MPRKEYFQKNRYCRRSKLSEDEFVNLVMTYFVEVVNNYSRENSYFYYLRRLYDIRSEKEDRYIPIEEAREFYLSRPTFTRYFEKIGQYIWDSFIVNLHPQFREKDGFDNLLDLIYEKTTTISPRFKEFLDFFDKAPLYINSRNIQRSFLFHLLRSRSKVIKGYKKDKFYLEFSRVFFICTSINGVDIELESIYTPEKDKKILIEICWYSKEYLLHFLKENPM